MDKAGKTYITIGKVGATYGVHGWLKIRAFTEIGADILNYPSWYLSNHNANDHTVVHVEDGRIHGNGIIVKLKGYDSPEKARTLTGKSIVIERSELPQLKEKEYYWSDLEGLNVINKNGDMIGKVMYLIATGSNDVLIVKGEKEIAIPYLPGRVILEVDLENKEIHVDWEIV